MEKEKWKEESKSAHCKFYPYTRVCSRARCTRRVVLESDRCEVGGEL